MLRSDLIAAGVVLGLAGGVCTRAQDPSKPRDPAPAPAAATPAEPGKKVELGSSDLGGLNTMLPIGKSARKVVIPSIDEEGVLTSVTRMGKITRIDEDHFALESVLLSSFDPEKIDPATEKPETTVVKISKGVYISSQKQLLSDRPVRITKPGLEMVGESLIYWSVEGHAILKGHVEALLTGLEAPASPPSADESDAPDAEPEEKAAPASAPASDRTSKPTEPSRSKPQ